MQGFKGASKQTPRVNIKDLKMNIAYVFHIDKNVMVIARFYHGDNNIDVLRTFVTALTLILFIIFSLLLKMICLKAFLLLMMLYCCFM